MSRLSTTPLEKRISLTLPYFHDMFPFLLKFYKHYNCTVYEGFNNCNWNGGRIKTKDLVLTKELVLSYNKKNIKIASTFSNNIIDLSDKIGLELLEILNNPNFRNEIILSNEQLRLHILDKQLNLNLKFSITGHTNITEFYNNRIWNKTKILNYYLDLFNKYDIVVIHSELAIKQWFIKFLKANNLLHRTEVILNIINGCSMCPLHKEHYELISAVNRKELKDSSVMGCILEKPKDKFVDGYFKDKTKAFLIKTFTGIKLEGRSFKSFKEWKKLNNINFVLLRNTK